MSTPAPSAGEWAADYDNGCYHLRKNGISFWTDTVPLQSIADAHNAVVRERDKDRDSLLQLLENRQGEIDQLQQQLAKARDKLARVADMITPVGFKPEAYPIIAAALAEIEKE